VLFSLLSPSTISSPPNSPSSCDVFLYFLNDFRQPYTLGLFVLEPFINFQRPPFLLIFNFTKLSLSPALSWVGLFVGCNQKMNTIYSHEPFRDNTIIG
jgi:hypothetical protein